MQTQKTIPTERHPLNLAILVWLIVTFASTIVGSTIMKLTIVESGYFLAICSVISSIFSFLFFKLLGGRLKNARK
jgi:uncharacterized membrane protein